MSKAMMLEIKPGDIVKFKYEGAIMDGCVTCINHLSNGDTFFDILMWLFKSCSDAFQQEML